MIKIETGGLVDEAQLRLANDLFREAGEKGLTRKRLASLLEVSLRTADRTREVLRDLNGAKFELRSNGQRREKTFCMTKSPKWDLHISKEARLALRVAAQALSHGGGHLFADQLTSLERLADQSMTATDRDLFHNLKKNVRVIGGVADDPTDDQAKILESVLMAFSSAIPQVLDLEYQRPRQTKTWTLQMAPYCLTQDMFGGGTYLLGWDVLKRRVVQLRTSRILAAKATGRPAIFPNPELLKHAARFQMGGWISTDESFEVRIRIKSSNWMQALDEAQPDFPDFNIRPEPGGQSALVTFQANHLAGPTRWVLQMGEWAEVIAPEALKEEVLRTAKAILGSAGSTPD